MSFRMKHDRVHFGDTLVRLDLGDEEIIRALVWHEYGSAGVHDFPIYGTVFGLWPSHKSIFIAPTLSRSLCSSHSFNNFEKIVSCKSSWSIFGLFYWQFGSFTVFRGALLGSFWRKIDWLVENNVPTCVTESGRQSMERVEEVRTLAVKVNKIDAFKK